MKKLVTLFLAVLMVLSIVPTFAEEEPMTIRWIGFETVVPDTDIEKMVEEKFNVKIESIQVDSIDKDAMNMFWAGEGKADMITIGSGGYNYINMLIDQGFVRPYDMAWLYEYMPEWMEKTIGMAGSKEIVEEQITHNNGNCYVVPLYMQQVAETGLFIIRQDWLDNLGMEMPTTLDELHDVLYAFTYSDPDGNGVDDTYGMNGNGRYYFNYIFGAYGIQKESFYLQDDGSVVYTSATDAYKEVMKLLASWYAEGIIDPETITDDRTKQREKWAQGKFGVLPDNAFWVNNGIYTMVTDVNPNAKLEAMPAITGPDGLRGSYVDYPNVVTQQGCFLFGADASDEMVLKIMEIKESFAADYEWYKRVYFGVENVDYTWEDGAVKRLVNTDERTLSGVGYFFSIMPKDAVAYADETPSKYVAAHKVSAENPAVYVGRNFYLLETNESADTYGADVTTIVQEWYNQALMGKVDIDADWDNYIASLNDAGLDKIIEEYEELLK